MICSTACANVDLSEPGKIVIHFKGGDSVKFYVSNGEVKEVRKFSWTRRIVSGRIHPRDVLAELRRLLAPSQVKRAYVNLAA